MNDREPRFMGELREQLDEGVQKGNLTQEEAQSFMKAYLHGYMRNFVEVEYEADPRDD